MVRHDEEMFKVHPEDECRDDPAVTDMRNRDYWVGDPPPDNVRLGRYPFAAPVEGLILTQPTSVEKKLDRIIELLEGIMRILK